jgi:uncharacterized membrane protein HdeD (DUF308 family)
MKNWLTWFLFWLIISAILIVAGVDYAAKHPSTGCAVLAVFLGISYAVALAALVKSFFPAKVAPNKQKEQQPPAHESIS